MSEDTQNRTGLDWICNVQGRLFDQRRAQEDTFENLVAYGDAVQICVALARILKAEEYLQELLSKKR